jgi:DNA-directed RNA polymerase specialized sigma24 family protein
MTYANRSDKAQQGAADHAVFCEHILPAVERHARIAFRHLKCADAKQDAIQETIGLAWAWFCSLARRGKDATAFPTVLASYAARAVRSGRRVCGRERKKDVLSPVAQREHGFAVEHLPHATTTSHENLYASPHGQDRLDAFEERLRDNTQTPPDEQAAFRIDFPEWRRTHSERDRRLIDTLMLGERTQEVSRKFGVSEGRISQLRREFYEDWRRFHNESG